MVKIVSISEIHELVNTIKENKNLKIILKFCCKRGNSLLHILINEEDIEGFKSIMCIIKEVNKTDKNLVQKIINMKNADGDTAAHIAVRKSNNQNNIFSIMVETLISVGADLTISNNNKEVIVQTCDKPYNKEGIQQQQYINNCIFDSNNIYLNMIDTLQSDDNESSDDLDNIQTINSPLNHQFPLKVDILVIDKKQYQYQDQDQDQDQNQYQYQNQNKNQYDFKQILKQQLEQQLEQKQEQQKLRQNFLQQRQALYGGGKSSSRSKDSENEISGKRKINNPYISNGGSKKSEKNHSDAIEKIRKLGYSEEEAKDVKNFLYYEIKENFPDLNNDERSEKFAEVIETFKTMDIKKVRKELEKYRERNNKNAPPKKEHQKELKKEPKKEKKSSKRSSKKKSSKRSSKKRSSKRSSK
jgi:hypothetical protein